MTHRCAASFCLWLGYRYGPFRLFASKQWVTNCGLHICIFGGNELVT
uniref:Uncharacterized protein n=1 Tax=Setaria italica TaxID=4555 RepID=K3YFN4_SETIT